MSVKTQLRCPLCLGWHDRPRVVQPCLHSFCEGCICSYVSAIVKDGKTDQKIECPVCKTPFKGPSSVENISEWLFGLPVDHTLIGLIVKDSKVMSEYCEPCSVMGVKSQAFNICVDCCESHCQQCSDVHSSSKGTKSHVIVAIGDASENNLSIEDDTFPPCTEHRNKKEEFYCTHHDAVLCSTCALRNHKICQVVELTDGQFSDRVSDERAKAAMNQLKLRMESVCSTTQSDCDAFDLETLKAKSKIEDVRRTVNCKLDAFEKQLSDKATSARKQLSDKQKKMIQKKEMITAALDNSLAVLESLTKQKQICRIYMLENAIVRQMDNLHLIVDEIQPSKMSVSIDCNFTKNVLALTTENSMVGNIEVNITKACPSYDAGLSTVQDGNSLERKDTSNRKAKTQGKEHEEKKSKDDIVKTFNESGTKVSFASKEAVVKRKGIFEIEVPYSKTTYFGGATFLEDGRIVLTDVRNYRIVLIDSNFKYVSDIELHDRPEKVMMVNSKTIAVSLKRKKKLLLINVAKILTLSRSVYVGYFPRCIVSIGKEQCYVSCSATVTEGPWHLVSVNTSNGIEQKFEVLNELTDGRNIAVSKTETGIVHVLNTSRTANVLRCNGLKGNVIFSYKLSGPAGVDVDKLGNIYIASHYQQEIHQISKSGKRLAIIESENLWKPCELRMNTSREMFLVTQFESSKIHVFEICYR